MRNSTNRSRSSLTIALSLGFLAMTLGQPALAAGQRDAMRGGKRSVVRHDPSPAPAPPLNIRVGVIEKTPPTSVGVSLDTLLRVSFALWAGKHF